MNKQLFSHTKNQEHCPKCGGELLMKQGKKGLFLGCANYPHCDYLKPLQSHSEHKIIKELNEYCPDCGHQLQLKQGSYGMFIGCSNYPNCHFIFQEENEEKEQEFPCPECRTGKLVARRGRTGKTFYGCNRYPKCKCTLPTQPEWIDCPECKGKLAILKKSTKNHRTWQCVNKTCRHIFDIAIDEDNNDSE